MEKGISSRTPTSNDRSRTYWTPVMDQFFIDLLIYHMHRGNRSGPTFNKQAWTDMLTAFNAKFKSQYEKDVLKSHYTTLWKQFYDIKNLLDRTGFSWDNTQQMVVADDHVWDAYIKAHPDAQAYRNRALMNFNDLYLIYAHTTADGRYSLSSHDIDFDDDFQGLNFDEVKNTEISFGCEHAVTYWMATMDCYFVDLLLDQMHRGNRVGHVFKTEAWIEMLTLFNAKFGSHYSEDVLKDRFKHLKRQYNDVKTLLDQRGFSWDESQQVVRAEDFVWDSYIEVHPGAESYRNSMVPSYHKLCIIYGLDRSDRRYGHLACNVDCSDEVPVLIADAEDMAYHADYGLSKTDWTPSMDRCFIDLMLVQVHKGSKINHKLNKQAWLDIVTSFNETFGSEHDKNMLRNRHENLGRLYREMKKLLDQNGFSWDEVWQKVTACDNVWAAYVKEHPEAKSFKTERKPNFNDLSLIYGCPDGGFNGSNCNVNFHVTEQSNFHESDARGGSMTGWTPPMDRYFIDLMLEEVRKGGLVDCEFNIQAWTDMVAKFNMQFGPQHDEDVLKIRFKNLRRCFHDIKALLEQGGFKWDEMQQMVMADDNLWNAYIKENPDAAAYRSSVLPNYNDLFLIYGNVFASEEYCRSGCRNSRDLEVLSGEDGDDSPASCSTSKACANAEMDISSSSPGIKKHELLGEMQSLARDMVTVVRRKRRRSSNLSNPSFSRKVHVTWKERARRAAGEISKYTSDEDVDDTDHGSSIESIVDALQAIPDMNDELFLDACKLLEDGSRARRFVALDVSQRKTWLLRKLGL